MGFYAGLQVSVLRELPFAFIQFPLYEGLKRVRREEGALALFRGLGPRVGWMTLGGYIFFGAYEQCLRALTLMGRRDARDARDAKDAKDARRDGTPPPPPFP